jgi:hypothetical protein
MLATIQFSVLSFHLLTKNLKIKLHKTIILPLAFCVCETRSLTLKEKHRLRMFENRVLRRTFGPMREKVVGGWRRLHNEENEELHNLYTELNIVSMIKSRGMRWAGHILHIGEMEKSSSLVGKPEGKRPFGRPLHRWECGS